MEGAEEYGGEWGGKLRVPSPTRPDLRAHTYKLPRQRSTKSNFPVAKSDSGTKHTYTHHTNATAVKSARPNVIDRIRIVNEVIPVFRINLDPKNLEVILADSENRTITFIIHQNNLQYSFPVTHIRDNIHN